MNRSIVPRPGLDPARHRPHGEVSFQPSHQLWMLFLLLLAFFRPVPAVAQNPVTELTVIYGGSSGIQPPAGFIEHPNDLNQGAGGDFVWLWYTKDPACQVIREVAVQDWAGDPPEGLTKIPVDVNSGAGGAFIYVVYVAY